MIGATLDHFRITAKLGEGGMGEVYRAEDTRLGREVAIKVLPQAFVADPDRLSRFEREARLLASLNHPNIAAIYEVGEAVPPATGETIGAGPARVHYLVMEVAEGETLDERIARSAVPVAEALSIALQIAEALEAAHQRGIVHRDLKPGNVAVDEECHVKVLDFGLAKALEPEPTSEAAAELTLSPTLTYRAGVLLGTAGYMSPEQARGKAADERSDLWALGVVLWEMLTGRRLFAGDTVSETLASVLKEDPDWSELPIETPLAVRRLLRRCLTKDPNDRLHHAADARLELREASSEEPSVAVGQASTGPRSWGRLVPWALVVVLALVLAAAHWRRETETRSDEAPRRVSISVDASAPVGPFPPNSSSVVLSPDGKRLVYLSAESDRESRLWLRELDDFGARPIPGTEGALSPFFSPNGEWLAFFADGKLKKMPIAGGASRTICEAGSPRGADWGDDGFIVFSTWPGEGLLRVSADGGSPEQITELDPERDEVSHRHPHILPGGGSVLFTALREGVLGPVDRAVDLVHLASGERRALVEGGMHARVLGLDYLIWARPEAETTPTYSFGSGTLMGSLFDPEAGELTGPHVPLMEGVATVPLYGTAHYTVAGDQTLAFLPATRLRSTLAWVAPGQDPEPLPLEPRPYVNIPRLSPDGGRIAVTIVRDGRADVWIHDLERDTLQRLTFDGSSANPIWTPDGRLVTYNLVTYNDGGGGFGGFSWKPVDGTAAQEQIVSPEMLPPFAFPSSWSADGELLAFTSRSVRTSFDLWIADFSAISPGDGEPELRPVATSPADEIRAVFSPQGRWLAYSSDESGRPEVYVVDVERPAVRRQISSDGGDFPSWSGDGRTIYYLRGNQVFAVEIELGRALTVGRPRPLGRVPTPAGQGAIEMDPAGERFLVLLHDERSAAEEIRVVLGWGGEVRRRLGAAGAR